MVSAESLSVARKHRTTINVDWSVPGLMAGNIVPSYDDEGGRVVRRLAVFPFDTLVTNRDTRLKSKILTDELPSIALQCVVACHDLRERVGDDELRKHLPKSVLASEDEIRANTSPLYNFVVNGDDFWDVVHDPKAETTLLELRSAYQNHARFHRQDGAAWTGDHHPIKMAGFTVTKTNMCKQCGKVAKQENCGDHYDSRNRKRVHVVEGMRLKKKARDGD
jgi:phage/plasmid-associated DNA primase